MRVPVDLVTGYLGSGKTTLVRHVLEAGLCGERVAVLVNDVGAYGIDGRVIGATSLPTVETVLELDNGCFCCSADGRFEYAVQDVVENLQPDLVLIEASGVADPRLLLGKLEPTMLVLDAIITVVDCENLEAVLAESEAAMGQVLEADFLVLNKIDLVAATEVERLAARLAQLNPRALQERATFARTGTAVLFGSSVRRYRNPASRPPISAPGDGIESFGCESTSPFSRQALEAFLCGLPAEVYRAKGLVRLIDEEVVLFNYVRGRVRLEPLPASALKHVASQAVFLGRELEAIRPEIEAAFGASARDGA